MYVGSGCGAEEQRMIADVLHFSFTVRDIVRSVDWYTDVLGLELVHRQTGDNDYTRTLVGVPDAVLKVAQFKIPGLRSAYSTHLLELVEYAGGAVAGEKAGPINRVGGAHLGFLVTDIHERYRELLAVGVDFANPPVRITEGVNEGGYACYLRDPDGNTLEFLQFSDARAAALGLSNRADPDALGY